MSGFGKFIGLLAVGAIGFVVYSCIVYDPDAASSDVKSNDSSSASEMNAEAADKNFNIVGDWMWKEKRAVPISALIGWAMPKSMALRTLM